MFFNKKIPMTNADHIRAMSDENLAEFLSETWDVSAKVWKRDWLQQSIELNDEQLPYKIGDTVWCIERDEDGELDDISGYKFLIQIGEYIIVSVCTINGHDSLSAILDDAVEQTKRDYYSDLFSVFPATDVYLTFEEALEAKRRES